MIVVKVEEEGTLLMTQMFALRPEHSVSVLVRVLDDNLHEVLRFTFLGLC